MFALITPTMWMWSQMLTLGESNLRDISIIWMPNWLAAVYLLLGSWFIIPSNTVFALWWYGWTWWIYAFQFLFWAFLLIISIVAA